MKYLRRGTEKKNNKTATNGDKTKTVADDDGGSGVASTMGLNRLYTRHIFNGLCVCVFVRVRYCTLALTFRLIKLYKCHLEFIF